jgi:ribosomal protein S18 acetylase RimI-like enzyme
MPDSPSGPAASNSPIQSRTGAAGGAVAGVAGLVMIEVDLQTSRMIPAEAADLRVREAVASDAEGIAAIGRVAFPELHKAALDQATIELVVEQIYSVEALVACIGRCARARDAHFLVAERGGLVAGYLHYDCDGPEPELHRIYVDPEQKGNGIGSALMRELHQRLAPGASYVLLVLASNTPAIEFYRRHGLHELARLNGVEFFREHTDIEFPPGTPEVPALVLRFTNSGS